MYLMNYLDQHKGDDIMGRTSEYDLLQSLVSKKINSKKARIIEMWSHISLAREKGFSYSSIWETLKDDNQIDASYRYFMDVVNDLIFTEKIKNSDQDKIQEESVIVGKGKTTNKKKCFSYNPNYSEDNLI